MTAATFIVPAGAEARTVRRAARGARVVAVRAGAAAARSLPADLPEEVVVLGLCGALRPLPVGAVAIYAAARDGEGAVALDVTPVHGRLPGAHVVSAYTAPHVIARAAARTELARRFDATVVDMETTHLARVLAARGVRCAVVRVVSDSPAHDLPPIERAFDARGRLRPWALALGFARDRRGAVRFVGDVQRGLRVLRGVARALGDDAHG
jgi:nucleoside phosphorylase